MPNIPKTNLAKTPKEEKKPSSSKKLDKALQIEKLDIDAWDKDPREIYRLLFNAEAEVGELGQLVRTGQPRPIDRSRTPDPETRGG